MLSYNNDSNLKGLVIAEMKRHQEQDQFIKGTYYEEGDKFNGCSVGCTIDSVNKILGKHYSFSNHKVLGESIGLPAWLARLQDVLFDGIPDEDGAQFSVDFLDAIPVGVNLEPVKYKFCAFILRENIERVSGLSDLDNDLKGMVLKAIRDVLALHEKAIETGEWDSEEARSAESAARSAESAAWSSAMSAESVESSAYKIYAGELINFLKELES